MSDDDRGPMQVDPALVRELVEMLAASDLSEIEIEDGHRRIRLRRKLEAPAPVAAPAAPVAYAAPTPAPAPSAPASPPAAADVPAAAHPGAVKSPMVGTAYLSPEPGARPFVSVGDTVAEGDTLLIVEAMKVMNTITATRGGTVREVLVANGEPIEYDQPLVVIE